MQNSIRVAISLLSVVTAGAASAGSADPVVINTPVIAAAVPAAPDWGGFYLGATYGVGVGGTMEFTLAGVTTASYGSLEPGQSYGAFAGYNVQRNKLVFGGELAYSAVNTPGFGPIGFTGQTFDYFIDGKARVGVALNKVLVYGFAGYSGSHFTSNSANSDLSASGFNYGAGIDFMLGNRFFLGAEYIGRNLTGTDPQGYTQKTYLNEVQVRAGLKF